MSVSNQATDAEAAAEEIVSVLDSLTREYGELSDDELDTQLRKRLPEPSATDPRPVRAQPAVVHSISVRGIRSFGPEQTLHLSEGLTIVYAGNGKGKTSLTDAFELVADGSTTRKVGLPNAASEVKDSDHITHRTVSGSNDSSNPPRVTVRYLHDADIRECTWNSFNTPAPRHPDVQVLPRRLLRELVNAKRTERIEPLGAALGLPETSASWTAIAKALRESAKEFADGGEPYLKLLAQEVALAGDEDARGSSLEQWARKQKMHPEYLPGSPSARPWRELADDLEAATDLDSKGSPLSTQLTALLTYFVEVAHPDADCPACAQALVPQARLDEVQAMLAASEAATRQAELRAALTQRRTALAAQVGGWLDATTPTTKRVGQEPEDWRAALTALRDALAQREQLGDITWVRGVAGALEALDAIRARIAHAGSAAEAQDRRRAVDAITADADGTRQALDEREFRRITLAPVLRRAHARTRAQLSQRLEDELADLEGPINDWLTILGPKGTPRISFATRATIGRPSLDLLVASLQDGAHAPHATGYLSDAQLDMLGMSAHLARIERDHPGSTIVIDDPSDMLDSSSRKALAGPGIARLLDDGDRPAHQVVVLTHDDQLVRDLWHEHRHRSPATAQDTMEIHLSTDGTDSYSVLTSRSTADAVSRALALKEEHWENHLDRLWFRAALAAHTRQAAEMCAKDVDMLLGPAGLGLHPDQRAPDETDELGTVSKRITATLRETTRAWCGSGRHNHARRQIGELLDLLSMSSTQFLNPGAHADVVLPDSGASAETLKRLKSVAPLLAVPAGNPRSSWTTQCPLADLLQSDQGCPDCSAME